MSLCTLVSESDQSISLKNKEASIVASCPDHGERLSYRYSSTHSLYPLWGTYFKTSQWMPETMDSADSVYIYISYTYISVIKFIS